MISVETFIEIRKRFGHFASWAVWAEEGKNPKDAIDDLSVLDPEKCPTLLETLHGNSILTLPVPFCWRNCWHSKVGDARGFGRASHGGETSQAQEWRRGSESDVSGVVSGSKLPTFTDDSSKLGQCSATALSLLVADVFADSASDDLRRKRSKK